MEQRVVTRFFTLKRLKLKDIHAGLESVYDLEALDLPKVKSGGGAFSKKKRICLTIPGPKGP
jgi:hypothetical protein